MPMFGKIFTFKEIAAYSRFDRTRWSLNPVVPRRRTCQYHGQVIEMKKVCLSLCSVRLNMIDLVSQPARPVVLLPMHDKGLLA